MTHWRFVAATDIGLVRETNQDAIYVDDTLALVADGMGGHAAGEVASAVTTEVVRDGFQQNPTIEGLFRAIQSANQAVLCDARENPERFGMGTTVIAVGLTRDSDGACSPTLFNVGDSRAYQLRDGALRQLSDDHSVAEEWVRMGRLTAEEALVHPRRHQLTRAVGVQDDLDVDVMSLHALPGDRVLLCSDGLTNELSPETLANLASIDTSLEESVEQLITAAKLAGGRDNISVVLLEFDDVTVARVPVKKTLNTAPAPAPASASGPVAATRRRRLTWRVWVGTVVLLVVLGAAVAVVRWYAYSSYYLGIDGKVVAVYQGQPNGVLWFKPVEVKLTQYPVSQLRRTDQRALGATISEPSRASALTYANYMHEVWKAAQPRAATSTTTTTSTTTPVATTVKG